MAGIVYDGVPGHGDLFAGKKFFIVQRIPARNTLVQNVESNGGEVVPLEKQADMIIADHMRPKFAPDNSYSWQYIERSIKNGVLEDASKHLIRPAPSSIASGPSRTPGHRVGGSRPIKQTRTPFTQADDDFLRRWVAKADKRGIAVIGNNIYKQLERVNNRHTWQSWKDRWVKYYRDRAHPNISDDDDDAPGPVFEVNRGQPSRPRPVYQPSLEEDPEKDDDEQHASTDNRPDAVLQAPNSKPDGVVEGQEFTKSDHDLLVREYNHILEMERKSPSVIKAWGAFAKTHGRHTSNEYHTYFHGFVKPAMERKLRRAAKANNTLAAAVITINDDEDVSRKAEEEDDAPMIIESTQSSARDAHADVLSSKSPNVSSTRIPPKTQTKTSSLSVGGNSEDNIGVHSVSEDKAAFLEDLRTIARFTHKQIEPIQEICGSQIQLYELWSKVNGNFKSFENVEAGDLWPRVAHALGFDITQYPAAPKALRELYTTFLVKVGRLESTMARPAAKVAQADAVVTAQQHQLKIASKMAAAKHSAIHARQVPKSSPARCTQAKATERASLPESIKSNHPNESSQTPPPSGRGTSRKSTGSLPTWAVDAVSSAAVVHRGQRKKHRDSPSKASGATLQSFMENESIAVAPEEHLTSAEIKFLGRLAFFAKDKLGITIEGTGITVCSRWVSLPKLQEAVVHRGGFDTVENEGLWEEVAIELGLNPLTEYEGAPEHLANYYGEVLAHFDDFSAAVQHEKERRASLSVQGLQKLTNKTSDTTASGLRPSESQKRSRRILDDAGTPSLNDTFKRRRADRRSKGKEIPTEVPATPEHIYNSSFISHDASIVKDSQATNVLSEEESGDESDAFQPINRPLFKKSAPPQSPELVPEPETQEFSFLSPGTPSQRLHSEAAGSSVSPAPRRRPRVESESVEEEETVSVDPALREFYAMCETEGYAGDVGPKALTYANMNPLLAQKILSRVARGQPMPENLKGIWTKNDDDIIRQGLPADHQDMKKLRSKHGSGEVKERVGFLQSLAEIEEDD